MEHSTFNEEQLWKLSKSFGAVLKIWEKIPVEEQDFYKLEEVHFIFNLHNLSLNLVLQASHS